MIKKTITAALIMLSWVSFAQTSDFIWPVKGKKAGENILYAPQSYIDKELNFGKLFIGGNIGDTIISPVDGVITICSYCYRQDLVYMNSFRAPVTNFEDDITNIAKESKGKYKRKYINYCIGIKLTAGVNVYVSGLNPIRNFKTGEKIKAGDVLGSMWHSLPQITEPSINFSISKKSKPADPMTPFGLTTTFKPPVCKAPKLIITEEEMKTDLTVFVNALKEGFPGLYDYVKEDDFNKSIENAFGSIKGNMKPDEFQDIIAKLISKVNDFHLYIASQPKERQQIPKYINDIYWAVINDTLIVRNALEKDSLLIGKPILSVDGINADSLKTLMLNYIPKELQAKDGFVESYYDYLNITAYCWFYFYKKKLSNPDYKMKLLFSDGTTRESEGLLYKNHENKKYVHSFKDYMKINSDETSPFTTKIIDNKYPYLGICTFELVDTDLDSIGKFVKSVCDSSYSSLIIDVRNNYGGNSEAVNYIFSLIAQKPFKQQEYFKVNKKGNFNFYKYCTNYGVGNGEIFPNYTEIKDSTGYYLNDTIVSPDSTINFKGKVYVLTNELSFSAATNFPALLHKYKRGAIVGRETRGAYHQLKAQDFAFIRLPNSEIDVRIPLIQIVFDTTKTCNIPLGRGVLPDFPVEFSIREIASVNGDSILNYAQHLIATNKYIKANIVPSEIKSNNYYVYVLALIAAVIMAIFAIYKRIKK